jgi:hypothetical protein
MIGTFTGKKCQPSGRVCESTLLRYLSPNDSLEMSRQHQPLIKVDRGPTIGL